MDPQLLSVLRCPATKQSLRELSETQLNALNEAIGRGEVKNGHDQLLQDPIQAGLITDNKQWIYIVENGIPLMLEENAINSATLATPL